MICIIYLGILYLWNAHSLDVSTLDLGIKLVYHMHMIFYDLYVCLCVTHIRDSLTLCLWSLNSQLLALGTTKGNLQIYNHRTRRWDYRTHVCMHTFVCVYVRAFVSVCLLACVRVCVCILKTIAYCVQLRTRGVFYIFAKTLRVCV